MAKLVVLLFTFIKSCTYFLGGCISNKSYQSELSNQYFIKIMGVSNYNLKIWAFHKNTLKLPGHKFIVTILTLTIGSVAAQLLVRFQHSVSVKRFYDAVVTKHCYDCCPVIIKRVETHTGAATLLFSFLAPPFSMVVNSLKKGLTPLEENHFLYDLAFIRRGSSLRRSNRKLNCFPL